MYVRVVLGVRGQVDQYQYLGAMISKDCKCEGEVLKRIGMAKHRFEELRKVLNNMEVNMKLRLRLLKASSGRSCSTDVKPGQWTLTAVLKSLLDSFGTTFLR